MIGMHIQGDLFAWVTVADGKNSLIGIMIHGHHTPLIAANRDTMEKLRAVAQDHAKTLMQPLRLVRFTESETLESYD